PRARGGPPGHGPGLRDSSPRVRQLIVLDLLAPRAAQRGQRAHRAGYRRVRPGDPGRGGSLVPGPWHPAADAVVGTDAERRPELPEPVGAAGAVARVVDSPLGVGIQPAWRRAARPARSEPAAARTAGSRRKELIGRRPRRVEDPVDLMP